jgi:hypothetical protein
MSAPTIEEARATHSQLVYDELMANFDATKWADITVPTTDSECDITFFKAGVFTFDLDAWETACAEVDGCTFDKTAYEPLAFGFLWQQGATECTDDGPYIMNKPGSTLPFEGLYFNHPDDGIEYITLYTGVTYDDASL